ncbi:MAG: hypothetical protein RIR00_2157, partial [Pseudomonadota bacterium]
MAALLRRLATLLAHLLATACLLLPGAGQAGETLINAENLQQEARQAAAAGEPLLVLYSRSHCPYCERVKREYLLPLQKESRNARLLLRQINQDSDAPLTDFQGQATRHAAWSRKEKVKLVPVVAFYGPDGQRLGEPLVGLRLPDFYGAYLEDQL